MAFGRAAAAEWHESLRPGVTREEILRLAGPPASSAGGVDTYRTGQGRLELRYADGRLVLGMAFDGPGPSPSRSFYSLSGAWPKNKPDLKPRQEYLKKGDFSVLPRFVGPMIRTQKYRGSCYEVDGQFLVLEPVIEVLGGTGYFADKTARALLVKADGTEEVLYRAADNWGLLRPPGLTAEEVRRRRTRLREAGEGFIGRPVGEVLGPSDSNMGSGIDYRLYYLEDALMVVGCGEPRARVETVRMVLPGVTNLTYPQWLTARPVEE